MPEKAIHVLRRFAGGWGWGVAILTLLSFGVSGARGDDAITPADATTNKRSTTDDDLFRKLTGDGRVEKEESKDPLERAIREMREARKRISEKDTGETTRGLQQDVVESLELLIQQLKQQSQKRSSGSGSSNPQPNNSEPGSEDPANSGEDQTQDDGKTRDDKSSESTENPRNSEVRKAKPLTPGRMKRDIWGHLPPALRQELLNVYKDKYLPQYSDLVRRYFESLAEEGRPAPRRK